MKSTTGILNALNLWVFTYIYSVKYFNQSSIFNKHLYSKNRNESFYEKLNKILKEVHAMSQRKYN